MTPKRGTLGPNWEDYTEDDGETFDKDGYLEDLAAAKADQWIKYRKENGDEDDR